MATLRYLYVYLPLTRDIRLCLVASHYLSIHRLSPFLPTTTHLPISRWASGISLGMARITIQWVPRGSMVSFFDSCLSLQPRRRSRWDKTRSRGRTGVSTKFQLTAHLLTYDLGFRSKGFEATNNPSNFKKGVSEYGSIFIRNIPSRSYLATVRTSW